MRFPSRLVLIVGVAVALGVVACGPKAPERKAVRDDKQRKNAPEFALKDATGKVVHLSDYRGKVVLLDFWATWCGPCNLEVPWFTEFERKYKDQGFEVLGVSMDDEGWKAINPFVLEKKINYRVVLGDDKTGEQYGGIEALPTTFVLDREGRIASVHIGLSDREDFEHAIEKLLQDPVDNVRGSLAAQMSPNLTIAPVATVKVTKGSIATVTLKASLPPGYHANSDKPSESYLIPLSVKWTGGPLKADSIVYPKPSLEKYSFSDKPLSVVTGDFTITTKFKVPADAATGPAGETGTLRFQACDNKSCYPPKNLPLNLTVNVE